MKSYIITMRPYLLFVSGAAGIVGLANIAYPDTFRIILAFIPIFLSYGLGQALTDCFQTDTDAISSPYRPLVQGLITRKQVFAVSLVGLSIGVVIMAYLNPVILILGVIAVAGLLTYTILKRTWWGGPPWNSWIVALLPIMGRLVDKEYRIIQLFDLANPTGLAFFLAVFAVFFGYANFVVMGYFKDISADAKTGYRTFPVVFGWTAAAIYSDTVSFLAAILIGYAIYLNGHFNIPGILIFFFAVGINLYAQIRIHLIRDENKTHGPIENVVRAFILYCLAYAVCLKAGWIVLAIIFYAFFELTLKLRPERKQV